MAGALQGLLVDVGGTLVNDETWLPRAEYHRRMVGRLSEAFGSVQPWFRGLVEYEFPFSIGPTHEQHMAAWVAAYAAEHSIALTRDEVDRVCRACALPLPDVVSLAPGAGDALHAARALGLRLAVCSNTLWRDDSACEADWQGFGFADCFDAYVTSRSTGYAKPNPAIFLRALNAIRVPPEAAAMVGDRLDRDVAGAAAAGIRSIWVRRGPAHGSEHRPDAIIESLTELPALLRSWIAAGAAEI